ncbi:IS1634 family transposase [Lacrimispora defluvii]|uniref:IS1634 family transposase n=1 Tax=Lacrimispora defluvii TaxID=2719233 RepID=A0ABX1VL96_9FIRM|nr:IS1634 family transposase [Lacrimispora defluvii]NNJ28620.1 IS1634 family transposase [Lacrimispora defluvii]
MRLHTSKSKNAESFYISKGYVNDKGVSTSVIVRKLGTLAELLPEHGPTRDDVVAWCKEQCRIETMKYKEEQKTKSVQITFHADRPLEYSQQRFYKGGYLFPQSVYYGLQLDKMCRKIKARHKYEFDLNAILSDLIYNRILEPQSKLSAYKTAQSFLEPPAYKLHDVYRALSILAEENDLIQSEVFKNSNFLGERNSKVLYYDCSNFYFEIEQEEGDKKYGKSKEHRPNPIVQMGLFIDGDGIPLAFSTFPGNQNEQTSLKPLESKILQQFGCDKFIYCSDAGLASQGNRNFNHMGKRSFIVTQSIKKLRAEDKALALNKEGFKRLSDDKKVKFESIRDDDANELYYKEIPYTSGNIDQRLIITYSPKYAVYQKTIRDTQVDRARIMVHNGSLKKNRKNPNDPARFIGKDAVTKDGEAAEINYYLDEEKISEESMYDGLYAVCTDLLDDKVGDILKVSEGRWQIEECFRIMKTDFSARPVYVQRDDRIKAHFLICFLALLNYRLLEKQLGNKYTCEEILKALREINFVNIEGQGYVPTYSREKITDDLHEACGFRTDYQFITKSKMKEIQKQSKRR